jgi:hypothetical protein
MDERNDVPSIGRIINRLILPAASGIMFN